MQGLRSVGTKLFVLFFVSTLISVLLVGIVSYRQSQATIERQMESVSRITVKEAAEKFGLMLKQFEDMSLQFSTSRDLQGQLERVFDASADSSAQMSAKMALQDALNQIARTNANIQAISLLNTVNVEQTISSASAGLTTVDREADWYKRVTGMKGTALWLPPAENGYTGLARGDQIALSRMIGHFLILFEIDSAMLTNPLESIHFTDSSFMLVTDADGKTLLSSMPGDSGRTFSSGEASKDNLVVSEPIAKSNWTLTGIAPLSELLADTKAIRNLTVLMSAAAAIAAIAIGLFMIAHIGKPLLRIRGMLNEAAKGNLEAKLNLRRKDEIGEVAGSFDAMMAQMRSLIGHTRSSAGKVLATSSVLLGLSENTANASSEISAATEEIADGSAQLAAEAERAFGIVESMNDDLLEVVGTAEKIDASSLEMKGVSEEGKRFMNDVARMTMEAEKSIDTLVGRVSRLEQSTGEMRKLFELMNKVTKDSKILSLNAGIEAARTGQGAGGGFKVIAGEMGRLSDQTRSSLTAVEQITETFREEISRTVEALKLALPLLGDQIRGVRTANDIFMKVHERSEAFAIQADNIQRVALRLESKQRGLNESIAGVSSFSRQASAASGQVAALSSGQRSSSQEVVGIAQELESLSQSLRETLESFKSDG